MRPKLVLMSSAFAVAIALAACGDDGGSEDAQLSSSTDAPGSTGAGAGNAVVQVGETDLGQVLTSADGFTLYAFTNDTDGTSTCEADCADAWPALLVDSAELPEGLDAQVFSVVPRSDGTFQLSANGQPLYRFAGDAAPGDTNGQGSGGVWFAVSPTGEMIQGDAGSSGAGAETGDGTTATSADSSSDDGDYGY